MKRIISVMLSFMMAIVLWSGKTNMVEAKVAVDDSNLLWVDPNHYLAAAVIHVTFDYGDMYHGKVYVRYNGEKLGSSYFEKKNPKHLGGGANYMSEDVVLASLSFGSPGYYVAVDK